MSQSKQETIPSRPMASPEEGKLEDQLGFFLYGLSREIIRRYRPMLDQLGLTYTQYIVMQALWERKELVIRDLCRILMLDYGTLSPVLNKLESKGLVERQRKGIDGRIITISATAPGVALRERMSCSPEQIEDGIPLSPAERKALLRLLCQALEREGPK